MFQSVSAQVAPGPAPLTAPGRRFEPLPWIDPVWHKARAQLLGCLSFKPQAHPGVQSTQWSSEKAATTFVECALFHGMLPLAHLHLKGQTSHTLGRLLAVAAARAARAARAQQQVLSALLGACHAENIPVMLLKGAALGATVYPDAILRPMRDLDVLVQRHHLEAMARLMTQLGFWGAEVSNPPGHHHLPPRGFTVQGQPVTVEVHHSLGLGHRPLLLPEELWAQARPIAVAQQQAFVPAPAHMLWHVYHHGFAMPFTTEATKIIWLQDLLAVAQVFDKEPDAAESLVRRPKLRRLLRYLHTSPWRAESEAHGPMPDYAGWPRAQLGRGGLPQQIRALGATLFPPAFWLAMRHGAPTGMSGRLWARLLHLRDLLQQVFA